MPGTLPTDKVSKKRPVPLTRKMGENVLKHTAYISKTPNCKTTSYGMFSESCVLMIMIMILTILKVKIIIMIISLSIYQGVECTVRHV